MGGEEFGFRVAEMPFANHPGSVTCAPEQLGQRDFGGRQSQFGVLAAEIRSGVGSQAAAERITARHKRSASRRAKWRGRIKVSEARALPGHAVEVRGFEGGMPVAGQVAVPEVIGEDDDYVGMVRGPIGCQRSGGC